MRRLLTIFMMVFASATMLAISDAEAKRLGGGKSSGMRRDVSPDAPKAPVAQPQQSQSGSSMSPTTTPAQKPGGMSRWLGPLAGFGLGALLMSMFGGSSFMGAFGGLLTIALLIGAVIFIIGMLRRKASPAGAQQMQYAGFPREARIETPTIGSGISSNLASPASASTPNARRYPEGFDADGFLRQAKVSFMRLQAANDAKDIRDIRDYTTPELYAELAMQIQERGHAEQKTEVVTLNADLQDVVVEDDRAIASVRFTGLVREEENGGAVPVDESWHVVKDMKNPKSTWLVAGIQQNA